MHLRTPRVGGSVGLSHKLLPTKKPHSGSWLVHQVVYLVWLRCLAIRITVGGWVLVGIVGSHLFRCVGV